MLLSLPMHSIGQESLSVAVSNPLNQQRRDVPVVIDLYKYKEVTSALVTLNGREIASQLDDLDRDGRYDELCFLADFDGKGTLTYQVELSSERTPRPYPARVYTEMVMRNSKVKQKNKHNNYIESITVRGDCADSYQMQHHHGVCFESELNGMRIYFDKRATPDLYGKKQARLELQATQFYTSDEQKLQDYGDDVLWVGNTFGLGAFRGWDGQQPTMVDPVANRTQRIVSYGPLRTIVEVEARGWQLQPMLPMENVNRKPLNMTVRFTQYAGHRDTDVDVFFNQDVAAFRFSTGLINVKGSQEYSSHKGLRGCWGADYPTGDTLHSQRETVGLGIRIPRQFIESEQPANNDNYGFVLKTPGRHISYKITYTSDNESFGFHTAESWFRFLRSWDKELDKPVTVTY